MIGRHPFYTQLVLSASAHTAGRAKYATSCGGSEAESIERDRVRLHKFEAGKPDRLLVERQRARTPGPRSKLCNQRVCK